MMYPMYQAQYPNYMTQTPIQTQQNNLLRVNGLEGAKAYQMQPNSVVALFDANSDVFYVKSSDAGGFSNISTYEFNPISSNPALEDGSNYVTRKEFNELKEMIENGKQFISKSRKQSVADDPTV